MAVTASSLVLLVASPVLADAGATSAADPAATSAADPTGVGFSIATLIWDVCNQWLIFLEDAVAGLFPVTPSWLKFSTLAGSLVTAYPNGPWFILHDFVVSATVVFGGLVVAKAVKTFWI